MEYIFPKRYKQSKKDHQKGRKVYERLIWLLLGLIFGEILLKLFLWYMKK